MVNPLRLARTSRNRPKNSERYFCNSKTLEVLQTPVFSSFDLNKTESSKVTDCISAVIPYDQSLIIAGDEGHGAQNFFNGKIERPFILKSSLNQKRLFFARFRQLKPTYGSRGLENRFGCPAAFLKRAI